MLPRVQKLLDERGEAIEGNIAKADEAQRKAEAALEEYTAQLADARTEAGRIRETARDDGKKIVAEAKEPPTVEAARVTASAQAQIEAERQTALVSLRSEVGTLAIDLASGVIGESLTDDAEGDRRSSTGSSPTSRPPRPPPEGRSSPWAALRERPWPDSKAALAELGRADLAVAEDLLAAGRLIGESAQLRTALIDTEADVAQKRALVEAVFGSRIAPGAASLLGARRRAGGRSGDDFLAGIEEIGIRVAADCRARRRRPRRRAVRLRARGRDRRRTRARARVEARRDDAKAKLVDRSCSARHRRQATLVIVRHLVQQPRGRRIGELLRHAASVVADQRGFDIATVTTAVPLTAAQLGRLEQGLAAQAGRRVRFDTIVDPAVLGGVRVQIGDDVIDGSVASRLSSLRQKLAG